MTMETGSQHVGELASLSREGSGQQITPTACTALGLPGSSRFSSDRKSLASPQQQSFSSGGQKARSLPGLPTFDIVANAGLVQGRDILHTFQLPERQNMFAEMLGHMELSSSGTTSSPKLAVRVWSVFSAP